ncbi:aliphatic sulfonate ABC transporter substrate-binding protein, partial [Ralstonia pseudosolanacearum]
MPAPSPHATATPPTRRRRWLAALLGAGLALCGGMAAAADPAGTVRIGFQKAGLLAVLKAQGAL